MKVTNLLLGKPISTDEDEVERVGPLAGVGILGLDALASAAYGPEALLTALLPLGAGAFEYLGALALTIIALLLILVVSYWQILAAYPNGGGAYTVARENLGARASLVAAAALSLDYVLNVSVAISAGVAALVSVFPHLLPHTLGLCLGVLGLLTLIHLRGVRATGIVVLIPTYLFVVCLFGVIGYGVFGAEPRAAAANGSAAAHSPGLGGFALAWLLARAFANGCTAMTGVEAVSNGVPLFRPPSVVGARRTLLVIVGILVCLLAGIAYACRAYGVLAKPPGQAGYESVLSQLVAIIAGRGPIYHVTMASVIGVLLLSANTSFASFPRVCRMLAEDKYLPEPFVHRGRRLVFSHGIWVLAVLSAVLLIAFAGITDHLIPLFAMGALSAFTISQAGMVAHFRGQRGARARSARLINLAGASATGLTFLVVLVSKFGQGAWITLLLVIIMLATFLAVHAHYEFIAKATQTQATLEVAPLEPPVAVVPLRRWDAMSLKALRLAVGMAREVFVVQVLTGDREVDELTERWDELVAAPAARLGIPAPELIVKRSQYRNVFAPVVQVVAELARENEERTIAVIVPELVESRWYHNLLHGQTAALLRLHLRALGRPQVVIVQTPWSLRDWLPERRWLLALPRRWWSRRPQPVRVPQELPPPSSP